MSTFVVSPAAMGAGTASQYLPIIEKYHIAVVNREDSIFESIEKGDLVIIAQGANWQKKVYFAGLVTSSQSYSCDKEGVECDFTLDLAPFVDLKNTPIPFNEQCTGGESKNPRAVSRLKPGNEADKKVIEAVMAEIQKQSGEIKVNALASMLTKVNNLVLTGAPGTGKTYLAWQIASALTGDTPPFEGENVEKDEGTNIVTPHIGFCQFHPSMDYTDFVEGLRPQPPAGDDKDIHFNRKDGIFKAFCDKACKDPDAKYVFIIDEINRGDISKVFGELFFAIDPGYRGKRGKITTQYANLIGEKDSFKDGFYVPNNVYIIGTMNDIDRGVESMDFAIRRRFTWREVGPEETQEAILGCAILDESLRERAKNRMDNLNKAIADDSDLGPAFQIGAAYFAKLEGEDFDVLWRLNIAPLLREYLRGNERKVIEEKINHFHAEYIDETCKTKEEAGSNPAEETSNEG